MKLRERMMAIKMRRTGQGYPAIQKRTGVSRSTLSLWLREVELTRAQKKQLLRGRAISREAAAQKRRATRLRKTTEIINAGKKEFHSFSGSQLFLSGLMLYWAEGDKHKQEKVKFTNSDPEMIAFMMKWFREVCNVPEEKFRIAVHIHTLQVASNIKNYWVDITGVRPKQFNKIYVKPTSLGQRKNVLYRGTCAIVVNNKDLFRRIVGWKKAMLEHFKILRP